MKELLKLAKNDLELAERIGLESLYVTDKDNLNLNENEFKKFINNNYSIIPKKLITKLLENWFDLSIFDPFKTSLITKLNGTYYIKNPNEIEKARFKINEINFSTDLNEKYDVIISDLTKIEGDITQLFNECVRFADSMIIINVDNFLADELISNEYFKAEIVLPSYQTNYSSLLIFDLNNKSEKYLLIDESNFLKGFNQINDWEILSNELIHKIIPVYNNFKEDNNSILVDKNININKTSKKRIGSSELKGNIPKSSNVSGKNLNSILKNKYDFSNNTTFTNQMYDKKMPKIENMLSKKGRTVIDDDVEFLKLGQLAYLKISNENVTDSNSLLMSTCGKLDKKLVFDSSKISSSCGDFIEINIKSEKILKEYLLVYLNSNKGLSEIEYFSNENRLINPENISFVRVPVPSIKSQKEIVKAVNESNDFFKYIKYLRDEFQDNILDYEHMMETVNEFIGPIEIDDESGEVTKMNKNWRHVIDRLIWPLAITYLSATRGGFEKTDKASKYLILFEFVAAFNSIILLSALPDDLYEIHKRKDIWNAPSFGIYRDMTFGNWIYLYQNLSKIYKKYDFSTGFDKKLFDELIDSPLADMLNETKEIRNKKVHGSMISPEEADLLLKYLEKYLNDVFDILGVYSDYKLIYTTGFFEKSDNDFKHRVILLNGPCKQPIYGTITFNKILDEKSMYLYNPTNNNLLLIDDKLIKFMPVDKYQKQWGIYVFNGFEKTDGQYLARYKYFQQNEEDYYEEINSFKEDIIR